MCQMVWRGWDDIDWFLYFPEDTYKIHGGGVLVLCRKWWNQLAGNLALDLLFPDAETGNISISSLRQWELEGD